VKFINEKTGEVLFEVMGGPIGTLAPPKIKLDVSRTEAPSAGGTETPADPQTPASDEAAKV